MRPQSCTATILPHAHLPGPDIHLDLGELRAKRAIGDVLGVGAAHALRA